MYGRRPTLTSLRGMVAAAHPLAAQAGARLLASGGNAFDAAAATAAALNVVEPYMSGFGGMGLAICYVAAEKRLRVLDFVTPIPSKFPVERFRRREELARGALAVGSPGNLAGWHELVSTYGRKPLGEALRPAIELARDGFPLIEFNVAEINETAQLLRSEAALYPEIARTYLAGGASVRVGTILRQPDLASTFEAIAAEGPRHLYGGPLGRAVVAHLAKLGGTLTLSDLEAVAPVWRDPIKVSYRGLDVHTAPPPCEGFQFLLTLRILEGFALGDLERDGVEHLDTVYRAIRLAASIRIRSNNPAPAKLAELLADESVEALRARVRDGRPISGPTEQWVAPASSEDPGHTTSFSIADRDGNMICLTQSLGSPFGSGVVVPGTGLCLNNFLFWSDVNPESPNRAKPGDALPMCMSPTLSLKEARPVLALGTPGSYGIMQTQVQALVQHLDFGLPLQEAIEAPRARLWDHRRIQVESRLAGPTVDALRARGHELEVFDPWTMKVGGMQAIAVDPATSSFTGAADPRRDGYAIAL